jgi:hypothetical protein
MEADMLGKTCLLYYILNTDQERGVRESWDGLSQRGSKPAAKCDAGVAGTSASLPGEEGQHQLMDDPEHIHKTYPQDRGDPVRAALGKNGPWLQQWLPMPLRLSDLSCCS